MSRVEYHSSAVYRAWNLPRNPLEPHRKRTFGFWIRDTVDRPLATAPTSPTTDLYAHHPLDRFDEDIRLLVLHAGREGDPIKTSLVVTRLSDPRSYESVSYVWGTTSQRVALAVSGRDIMIPINLMTALTYLRSEAQDRILWADAVCINQEDTEEKSHQVSLMRDIYATASRVVIWLGEASPDSSVGMEILRHWSTADTFDDLEAPWLVNPPGVVKSGLFDVLRRPWWERYWVVQEGSVAREVLMLCGSHELVWQNNCIRPFNFIRAVKLAVLSPQWQEAGLEEVEMDTLLGMLQMQLDSGPLSHVWSQRSKAVDLLEIAYATRHRKTTDVRDRIFSLVGMVGHSDGVDADTVVPDYSLSAEEAYTQFSAAMTRQTRDLCRQLDWMVRQSSVGRSNEDKSKAVGLPESHPRQGISGGSFDLLAYLKQMCGQAAADVRNNKPGEAAKLLGDAAMLLRGKEFASPSR
ncbi:hypothetical protein DOTSEDRAFT_74160 [Dothistroma septosporum NZE10]|uniref:Heterokaryon incompatibility domain-containing protein n=1 Tax=Dothistroma septosporum (strain NZE10 / CBS 128990) TaxID=675120 RepID=N1PFZ8_DOTSN|nr:hypothetical protein DOTSEDRAFT_74160 [Dothistroma septosporum NZE10]